MVYDVSYDEFKAGYTAELIDLYSANGDAAKVIEDRVSLLEAEYPEYIARLLAEDQ